MQTIVVKLVGGYWDGTTLRSDSQDEEEKFLVNGFYEMSHHGMILGECSALSSAAIGYARRHGYEGAEEATLCKENIYCVVERLENEKEIVITFQHKTE